MQTQNTPPEMAVDYNRHAAEYAVHRKVQPLVLRQLLEVGEINPNTKMLEVGCGTGNYISAIQSAAGCACWGIDPSFQMVARAKTSSLHVNFKIGRGEHIGFQDNFFDMLFSVDVIHHIQDKARFYQEAFRVLASGGLICTVTESSGMIQSRQPFAVYFPETVAVDLQRYPDVKDLESMMEDAGFAGIKCETIEFPFYHSDIQDFRDRAYSCLHLISDNGFKKGLVRMEQDLKRGPILWLSRYAMLWAKKESQDDLTGMHS